MEPQSQFDFRVRQFSTKEMLECVPGLPWETFRQWVKRGMVQLSTGLGIGRGQSPTYTGEDVLQTAFVHALTYQGLFVSKAALIWFMVRCRAIVREAPAPGDDPTLAALFFRHPVTGETMMRYFREDATEADPFGFEHADAPDVAVMLRVDAFLVRMANRMRSVKAGRPVLTPAEAAPPPDDDFMRMWDTDEEGRRVMVGLTFTESAELERYLTGDDELDGERFELLQGRHEEARFRRLAEDNGMGNRSSAATAPEPADGRPRMKV